jgi:hypothetical protein
MLASCLISSLADGAERVNDGRGECAAKDNTWLTTESSQVKPMDAFRMQYPIVTFRLRFSSDFHSGEGRRFPGRGMQFDRGQESEQLTHRGAVFCRAVQEHATKMGAPVKADRAKSPCSLARCFAWWECWHRGSLHGRPAQVPVTSCRMLRRPSRAQWYQRRRQPRFRRQGPARSGAWAGP